MAEGEATEPRSVTPGLIQDPSSLATAALLREITILKEQLVSQLAGEVKVLEAKIAAIDKATVVFQENLTRFPTEVTKAVNGLQQLHDARFLANERELGLSRNVIETRFDGMDQALKLLQDISDRFPDRIDEKIGCLKEIHDGQFDAIQVQFRERDTRTHETSKQSEVAISAALQAAKEAVGKSEVVTSKQIEDVKALFNTLSGALRDRLDEFTERFARIEGMALGQSTQKTEQSSNIGLVISLIVTAMAVIGFLITLLSRLPPAGR